MTPLFFSWTRSLGFRLARSNWRVRWSCRRRGTWPWHRSWSRRPSRVGIVRRKFNRCKKRWTLFKFLMTKLSLFHLLFAHAIFCTGLHFEVLTMIEPTNESTSKMRFSAMQNGKCMLKMIKYARETIYYFYHLQRISASSSFYSSCFTVSD